MSSGKPGGIEADAAIARLDAAPVGVPMTAAAAEPQAVVAPLTRAAIFLVVTVNPGADSRHGAIVLRRSRRAGARGRIP